MITERINELGLYDILAQFDGVVMGNSAGALVQLSNYHVSPDRDYPEFGYYQGLPYLNEFYLEVHFEGTPIQCNSIKRVIQEKGKKVYATHVMAGAIVVDNGKVKLIGNVSQYQ